MLNQNLNISGLRNGEIMWLDKFIIDIQELEMAVNETRWDMERFARLDSEYLKYGRNKLLEKYKDDPTYVYQYLNSDLEIYETAVQSYLFVKEKYEHKQRALELISFFHPESDLIDPRYYVSEEEREWKMAKIKSR
jgi:hypothetical protein